MALIHFLVGFQFDKYKYMDSSLYSTLETALLYVEHAHFCRLLLI
jgi:hypothetical protein